MIDYITDVGDEYWLCCGNVEGTDDRWMCFLDAKDKGLFGGRTAPRENAGPLLNVLTAILESEPTVSNTPWSEKR